MDYKTVIYEKIDRVAKITMNRPEYRNAESIQMSKDIQAAFKQGEADEDVRVIVLAGAGKDFSAGHDLGTPEARAEREQSPSNPQHTIEDQFVREAWRWLDGPLYIRDIPKPTIAMVQGHCIMGGFILATMCDLIVASEDASFVDMGQRFGTPAVEYFSHPWELGVRKAKEFLFTAEPITAQEAWRLGMVNRVVPRENLEEETMNLANKIALAHPFALRIAKMSCNATQDMQGYRNSMLNPFVLHQLGHAYGRENPDYLPTGRVQRGKMSVKEWIEARDKPYRDEKKKKK